MGNGGAQTSRFSSLALGLTLPILFENWRAQIKSDGNLRHTSSQAWEREKLRNELGSEGKRVAKFSQPLRNGPTKMPYS